MSHRLLMIVSLMLASAAAVCAQDVPSTARARDAHQNLLIAADPYVSADRYKEQFGKKSPFESGILAINMYFKNDNDSPIRLDLETIRLTISLPGEDRQKLSPLSPEEVADRALLKAHANPSVPRLPFPTGAKSSKGKAWDEMAASLRALAFATDVLPPHATAHGFLFFDMNRRFDAVRNAQIYIPDLSFMSDKKALFFFEIDLGAPSTP